MLLLLKCFSFQPPYTIYTSFSSPTNRDVPGTLSIFISSYPRSVLVSFSSLLHNRWKGAWLLMLLEMDRAVKLREREALLLVCTRLAGSGICTQLAFPLDYSRLFTSFFSPSKSFLDCFFSVSVRGGACVFCSAAARNRRRDLYFSSTFVFFFFFFPWQQQPCSRIYRKQKKRHWRMDHLATSRCAPHCPHKLVNSTSIDCKSPCLTRLVICA